MERKEIQDHGIYTIKDSFFEKYDPDSKLQFNKNEKRPHYYGFPHKDDSDIIWIIPLSSQIKKYEHLIKKQKSKGIPEENILNWHVATVGNRKQAFVIEDMFPVHSDFVKSPYFVKDERYSVKSTKTQQQILSKANQIGRFIDRGRKVYFDEPPYKRIEQDMLNYSKEKRFEISNQIQKDIHLYIYNGIKKPDEVEFVEDIKVESSVSGDITEEFKEAYDWHMEHDLLKEIQENQFLAEYGVWINPTRWQLEAYNDSIGLDKDEYLQDFEGHEQLFDDRETTTYLDLDDELER